MRNLRLCEPLSGAFEPAESLSPMKKPEPYEKAEPQKWLGPFVSSFSSILPEGWESLTDSSLPLYEVSRITSR